MTCKGSSPRWASGCARNRASNFSRTRRPFSVDRTPNPPKTLKQAIAQIVFDTYATKHHEALSPSDIDVRFELSPQGLLNPFHNDLVKARTTTNNEQVQLQSPASYPPCSLGNTQKAR